MHKIYVTTLARHGSMTGYLYPGTATFGAPMLKIESIGSKLLGGACARGSNHYTTGQSLLALLRRPISTPAMSKTSNNSRDTRDMGPVEKKQVHINRMNRPPYSHPDTPFNPRYEGSCFCGAVKFQISRERPLEAKFCHCHGCQLLHGAPFQWVRICVSVFVSP